MAPILFDEYDCQHIFDRKPKLTKEEITDISIVRIIKKDFEKYFGMSYDVFEKRYKYLLKNNPEKFI